MYNNVIYLLVFTLSTLLNLRAAYDYSFTVMPVELSPTHMVVTPGDTITFSMKTSPSSGLKWDVIQPLRFENKIYEIIESSYTQFQPQSEEEKKYVGMQGTYKIVIRITKLGTEKLQLIYGYPWLFAKIRDKDEQGFYNTRVADAVSVSYVLYSQKSSDL